MEDKNTGGPAFPQPTNINLFYSGMTLRDYFAANAMQAIMGSDRYIGVVGVNNYAQNASKDAYRMADAMLKARDENSR